MFVLSSATVALAENETINETAEPVLVSAEDNETEVEETEIELEDEKTEIEIEIELEDEEAPSVTPDEPIRWGLKRAIERIDLALTFNKAEKAKKGLVHAGNRLAEVEAMIAAKKLDAAEKAQKSREKIMKKVKARVEEMGDGTDEDIEDVLEIENEADNQENRMNMLKVKYQFKGNLTEEQKAKIGSLIESFQNMTQEFKLKVEEKKTQTKLKIKAMREKTDEEIEELMQQKEEKLGIAAERSRRIEALTKVIEKLEEKKETAKGVNISGVIGRLTKVRETFENKTEEQQNILERFKAKEKEIKEEIKARRDIEEEKIEEIKEEIKDIRDIE